MRAAIPLRAIDAADADAVAALHAASWRTTYRGILRDDFLDGPIDDDRRALWRARLADGAAPHVGFVAPDGVRIAGFVFARPSVDPRWGHLLDNLHVAPGAHGTGLGRALLRALCDALDDAPIHLWCFERNLGARRFYERLGGRPVERLVEPPPGGGRAADWRYAWPSVAVLRAALDDTYGVAQDATSPPRPRIASVSASPRHAFSKDRAESIELVAGLGVAGDAHAGRTVRHRSRVARDPTQPNLRQVHLLHAEVFEMLAARGFDVRPAQLGENVTTAGIDLLALPEGTLLRLGDTALVRLTGLRNPCVQLDRFARGLMAALIERGARGETIRKAGVMGVVVAGGVVRIGDPIEVRRPDGTARPLKPV